MHQPTFLFCLSMITTLLLSLVQGCDSAAIQETKDQQATSTNSHQSSTTDETETADPYETRCGWLQNPTPSNIWLQDRDTTWTISIQGGYQAESDGDWWPNFSSEEWVEFNGNYGYGCACLEVITDEKSDKILNVKSGQAKPLAACEDDPQLAPMNN